MNRSLLTLVICNATAWLTCAAAIGQPARAPESFDLNRIDSYLAAQVLEKGRVGLSVAIVKNGQTVLEKAYGRRSLQEQLPVEPDSMSCTER